MRYINIKREIAIYIYIYIYYAHTYMAVALNRGMSRCPATRLCYIRMSRPLVSYVCRGVCRGCFEKEIRNPCSSKKGLVAKACRGGLSRRFVADCLSQAERLCYKPYVAERCPGANYIPRLLKYIYIYIYILYYTILAYIILYYIIQVLRNILLKRSSVRPPGLEAHEDHQWSKPGKNFGHRSIRRRVRREMAPWTSGSALEF